MSSAEPSRRLALALLAAGTLAAWGGTLGLRTWARDDRVLILENPLLRAGAAAPLLLSGYHQAVMGEDTPIHQWRPMLSLSFLAQTATTGFAQLPLRAVNLLLHFAVVLLLHEALRRRLSGRAALAGALLWSALPVHAEVTAYLTSRSELLGAASVLGAWLLLGAPGRPDGRRLAAGAGVFLLGCLSKEHALLFPLFLASADWTFAGARPWDAGRRRVYAALAGCAALALAGRALVLPALAAGGVPYFPPETPWLVRLLTLSKFWVAHYGRPLLTGTGACLEYGRPLIPDSGPGDLAAWACLLGLAAFGAAAARALARRREWGFWALGPALFLLPTSHLLMDLDTIGAQRFLYLPSLGLAWAAAAACARFGRPAFAAVGVAVLLATGGARAQTRVWSSEESLHRAALACNPVSPKSRSALGVTLLETGRLEQGRALLEAALAADPRHYPAAYNLALADYRAGDLRASAARLARARALRPGAPDGLALEGLLAERAGRWPDALAAYAAAAEKRPYDAAARWNLARALAKTGRPDLAAAQVDAFLRLAPGDPDAPEARRWRERLAR
ncbi:MAG: tetratricopeptide repeat protein [Elusimicrobiota bacterium]|nr:tetratricopeptide repeat protein [Elusimicrobiota bacterium]